MMYEHRQSDGCIVPAKSSNNPEPTGMEGREGRQPAKGNAQQCSMPRTQGRIHDMPVALEGIRLARRRHDPRQEPDAVTPCAMSRTEGIATGSGRSSGQMTPRRTTNLDLKGRGNNSMLVKRRTVEDVYTVALQRLSDRAKAGLPESQCPGMEPHILR